MMKKVFIVLLIMGAHMGISYGQVAIGGGNIPLEGALLDLKEQQANINNVTASKGLLMPRVMLTDLTKLTPMVDVESLENQKEHIGLQVYHVGGPSSAIDEGLKIWDGDKWVEYYETEQQLWHYMPILPLDLNANEVEGYKYIDMYAHYKECMTRVGLTDQMYPLDKIDFELLSYSRVFYEINWDATLDSSNNPVFTLKYYFSNKPDQVAIRKKNVFVSMAVINALYTRWD